jgi:hypothetical protein
MSLEQPVVDRDREIQACVSRFLKPMGFKKTRRTWRRVSGEIGSIFNLQLDPYGGGQFYLNIGFWIVDLEAGPIANEYQCHVRTRASLLVDENALGLVDSVFNIKAMHGASEVDDVLERYVLPVYRGVTDKVSLYLFVQSLRGNCLVHWKAVEAFARMAN